MPVFDGEPAYKMMPTEWRNVKNFHGDWIVRKRAYWSIFLEHLGVLTDIHLYGVWYQKKKRIILENILGLKL